MNDTVVELELTLDKVMSFSSGQYIFIKIFQEGIEESPHPYTIARGQGDKIYVAIKKLGDGTKDLYDRITSGAKVKVDGPYGQFDFQEGKDKQVWIAGGIGITAFIAYLERENMDREIELFYTFRGEREAVYRELLEDYARNHSNFIVHFHNSLDQERLEIKEAYIAGDVTVYLCGPDKMIQHYRKAIKTMKKNADVRYEEFGFAR
jgi:predicted ferric reductase